MALFTGIIAAVTAVGAWVGTLGVVGGFALKMAVGIGISYLAQAIAGKKSTPQQQAASSTPGFSVQGKLNAGGDIGRSFQLGYSSTAGSLVYANTWGSFGESSNAYLVQVIALSDLPVSELTEVWVNGVLCDIDYETPSDRGYPVLQYRTESGGDHLWVHFYDGTQTVADSYLVNTVSSAARPYEATRVGKGVAYVVVTTLVDDKLWTGYPSFKFAVQGIPLYDISKDSTAGGSGSHRWSTPSTWGGDGDDLPAVQAYNLTRGLSFDGEWFYGLQNVAGARLPASNWIAQIAKCRAEVDGVDGSEPTYRSGGQIMVGNQLADTIEQLMTACQGRLAETGGTYKMHCGTPDSATFSFTDGEILSTEEQSFTPFLGLSDTINGIAAKYPSPAEGWNMKPAPFLYRPDFEAEDGNRRLMADVSLDMVPYAEQVQRLMSSALEEARRARRHTFVLPPEAWVVEPGDIVAWSSIRNGYDGKLFRVDGVVDRANLDAMLDLTEVDSSDYEWDHDEDFIPPTEGPLVFVRPTPQAIIDWFAAPYVLTDAYDIDRRPALILSWDGEQVDVAGVEFEVRKAVTLEVVHRGRTENVAAGSVVVSQSLLPNTDYQVRGRYIAASDRETLWSDWLDVTTPDVRFTQSDFADELTAELDKIAPSLAMARAAVLAMSLVSPSAASADTSLTAYMQSLIGPSIYERLDHIGRSAIDAQLGVRGLQERLKEAGIDVDSTGGRVTIWALDKFKTDQAAANFSLSASIDSLGTATATSLLALNSRVDTSDALLVTEQTTRASADSALASSVSVLTADLATANAAITSEATARATADTAFASTLTTLQASVGTNAAAILSEATTRASGDSANASLITSLTTTVGGHTATLSTIATSINGVQAQYGVAITFDGAINGGTGGFLLTGIRKLDGTASFAFYVKADDIVLDGSVTTNKLAALSITTAKLAAGAITTAKLATGAITAGSGIIDNLAVDTLQIAGNAVTVPVVNSTSVLISSIGATFTDVVTASLTVVAPAGLTCRVLVFGKVSVRNNAGGAIISQTLQLNVRGIGSTAGLDTVSGTNGDNYQSVFMMGVFDFTATGSSQTLTAFIDWTANTGLNLEGRTIVMLLVKR